MKINGKKILLFFIFIYGLGVFTNKVLAQTSCDSSCNSGDTGCLQNLEKLCAEKVTSLQAQSKTLYNQIAQFNAQIRLTQLKITQTEEKILSLGGRIDQLESSIASLEKAFSQRVIETYKMSRFEDNILFILASNNIDDAVSRFHYLKKIQEADRSLFERLQKAQTVYKVEKTDQEKLQEELETQKKNLDLQKISKAKLLEITKNDERKYQSLLSKARAELEAIQSILVGKGEETESGRIDAGSRIASVIPTSSACSSGAHLHFEVVKDKNHQNPTSFLSSQSVIWDNAPDGQFGFSGSWPWPINNPVRITQGYGMTYYASALRYYGGAPHTGIDIINSADYTVKAVKPGILYKGAIACGGGTLRYVRVKQDDGYDTYYLHINY